MLLVNVALVKIFLIYQNLDKGKLIVDGNIFFSFSAPGRQLQNRKFAFSFHSFDIAKWLKCIKRDQSMANDVLIM